MLYRVVLQQLVVSYMQEYERQKRSIWCKFGSISFSLIFDFMLPFQVTLVRLGGIYCESTAVVEEVNAN